ncbi:hypothetical protein [Cellulomonas sp. P24]|uniref:hypothetical protein n=1 Tax=Cellulomonas sp. P24 TaxID=2885206 RepID=UPI00216AC0CC|nr:hypothetical protein [Cellulomonas sp. P24]MCR6491942.1 hypothetical protein [Cellulomonas sp. P24]
MSTPDRPIAAPKTTATWYLRIAAAVVVDLGLALVVDSAGHPDAAAGVAVGGMVVVALAAVGRWRSARAADAAGPAARLAAGRADERDLRVRQGALAVVGKVALGVSGLASAATFLDVDATAMVRTMPFVLVLTMAAAFVVVDRRS